LFDAVRDVFVGLGGLGHTAGVDVGEDTGPGSGKTVDAAERGSAAMPPRFGGEGESLAKTGVGYYVQ
jgi:hypothetical protein